MRGRYFSTIIYLSVGQLVLININNEITKKIKWNSFIFILIAILISGISDFRYPFMSTENYIGKRRHVGGSKAVIGIQDERGFFHKHHGLLAPNRKFQEVKTQSNIKPDDYGIRCGHAGEFSLFWKSVSFSSKISMTGKHLIDKCALTDPLLSRIPAIESKFWRIGHNVRKIPTDYGELLIGNVSELPDDIIRDLANDVLLATKGEIFTLMRFKAIWRLNTGYYSKLDYSKYKDPSIWVPTTTKVKTVQIDTWYDDIETHRKPSINYISKTPMSAIGLTLVANQNFVYEISVNNRIIKTNLLPDDKREIKVRFTNPILVNSVQVRTVGRSDLFTRRSNFIEDIRLKSLWPES